MWKKKINSVKKNINISNIRRLNRSRKKLGLLVQFVIVVYSIHNLFLTV